MKEEKVNVTITEVSKIPKPTPLIGGTEVYQKEGLPYWYCRIKNGRDEFMHLYFGDLTNEDILYNEDGKKREFVTKRQYKFKANVMKALDKMPKEGFRWIPVYEPSEDSNFNLQYVAGKDVLIHRSPDLWNDICRFYSFENESRMATITTYFLLLLRFLKDGFATIEQLADDSREIGHYWDSKDTKHILEKTGERQLGGLYGFAGNTRKLVNSETFANFALLGNDASVGGNEFPLANVEYDVKRDYWDSFTVGWLELLK